MLKHFGWIFARFLVVFSLIVSSNSAWAASGDFISKTLVIPEAEQYKLGSKLFAEKDRKVVSWKAYQTFVHNYPESELINDAQYMVAEAIFQQAAAELKSGNPPDEVAWKEHKAGGFSLLSRGFKKSVNDLKNLGATVAGETTSVPEVDRIEVATFSEAIKQFELAAKGSRKSGLISSAWFRIGECYYNIGDYANALKYFLDIQKKFPQSYIVGEAILAAAQCYIPGGDFSSAESELQRLLASYPSYKQDERTLFIQGIIRYQQGRYEDAVSNLEGIENPDAIFYSGQALLKLNKGLAASAKFRDLFQKFKDSRFAEVAFYLTADGFFTSENYPAAAQEFRQFLELYPQSSLKEAALFRLGGCNFMQKDYISAREAFTQLINSYPAGEFAPMARYFIAESYRLAGQLKESSFSYGQLISQHPNNPITSNARFKLAFVSYAQKDYSATIDAVQKFFDWAQYHPMIPQAYFLLGNSQYQLGRFTEASIAYQQAFDRAQKTELGEASMALLNRTRYEQGFHGQLTSGYTYVLRSLPPSESKWRAISMLYLADAYYRQQLYREAVSIFQSIVSLYPYSASAVQARDGLSWSYFQLGDYEKAQTERENLQQVRLPQGVSSETLTSGSYELANALFNQKKYLQAIELYQKYLAANPKAEEIPETIYRIGLCYYRQESYQNAIDTWTGLISKYPQNARSQEAIFQVADTYFRAQQYDKSVETYRAIVAKYPDNAQVPEAAMRIGQAYYNGGKDDLAILEFDKFLKTYPDNQNAMQILDLMEASFNRQEANRASSVYQKNQQILMGLADLQSSSFAQEAQYRLALRYLNVKDYLNASLEFEKFLVRYPGSDHSADAQFYSAESNYITEKYENAISGFTRFINNYSGNKLSDAAHFRLATAYFNLQNHAKAIEFYSKLYTLYPSSEYAAAGLFNMALSQQKLLLMSDAADSYQKLINGFPKDSNVNFAKLELARIRQDLQQHDLALAVLEGFKNQLADTDDQKAEVLYMMSTSYLASAREAEAMVLLNSLSKLPIKETAWKLEALRKLGEIYEKKESWADAVKIYEDAAKIAGNTDVGKSFKDRAQYFKDNFLNR